MVVIAGRTYPTPLLAGGAAVVGVVVLVQRLRSSGQPSGPVTDVPVDNGLAGGGATPISDLGQFPSFPAATAPTDQGYTWWDPVTPPAPPINVDPVTGLPPTPIVPAPSPGRWYPASLGTPPAGTAGYITVNGSVWVYTVSGGRVTGRQNLSGAVFSAFVGAARTYPWAGHGNYTLVPILSGGWHGRYIALAGAVTYHRKP